MSFFVFIGPVNHQHVPWFLLNDQDLYLHINRHIGLFYLALLLISICTRVKFIGAVLGTTGRFHSAIGKSDFVLNFTKLYTCSNQEVTKNRHHRITSVTVNDRPRWNYSLPLLRLGNHPDQRPSQHLCTFMLIDFGQPHQPPRKSRHRFQEMHLRCLRWFNMPPRAYLCLMPQQNLLSSGCASTFARMRSVEGFGDPTMLICPRRRLHGRMVYLCARRGHEND